MSSGLSTSSSATTPHSPFSASFDPNASTPEAQTPLALRSGVMPLQPLERTGYSGIGVAPSQADALWTHRLSASFGAIADQIAAASRALATVEVPVPVPSGSARPRIENVGSEADAGLSAEVAALSARLDSVHRTQEAMATQLQAIQDKLAQLQAGGARARGEKDVEEVLAVRDGEGGEPEFKTATEMAIEELQKKVEGVIDTIKLDQARLYARMHNASVTVNKQPIRAPVLANGKTPPNFPATKGEFEHLTKERYEALLKGYNLPVKGDTNAKREALREFICLTPAV
ncbi:hypothetical protein BV20DRAFT_1036469 [Pilatotrama ljubarskyi]|nr:hypothetical protein BV20DRAFT_1036469 [Pilatotrama ljubarskyi]